MKGSSLRENKDNPSLLDKEHLPRTGDSSLPLAEHSGPATLNSLSKKKHPHRTADNSAPDRHHSHHTRDLSPRHKKREPPSPPEPGGGVDPESKRRNEGRDDSRKPNSEDKMPDVPTSDPKAHRAGHHHHHHRPSLAMSDVVEFHDILVESVVMGDSIAFDFLDRQHDLAMSGLADFQRPEAKPELAFSGMTETHEEVAFPELQVSSVCHQESQATAILTISLPTEIHEGERTKETAIEHGVSVEAPSPPIVLQVSDGATPRDSTFGPSEPGPSGIPLDSTATG
jgi:hypothetical protein